jgi:hypothetical protein
MGDNNSSQKLSKLQKQILFLALDNRLDEGRNGNETSSCDLARNQIMAEVYGFPLAKRETVWLAVDKYGDVMTDEDGEEIVARREFRRESLRDRNGKRDIHGKKFEMADIGRERYNAAQAAVSRAMARLEQRGLVTRVCGGYSHWAGINLTPAGVAVVQTVKSQPDSAST